MSTDDSSRTGRFDHLFADPVRDRIGQSAYGAWRSISAPDAVSLSFGFPFPDALPNDELLAAAEAVVDAEGDRALQYGGGNHADRLVEVVAERARDSGVDCDEEHVVLTNGATHAIDLVCRTFLEPGDAAFVEAPTFMGGVNVFRNFGVDLTGFPVDEDGLDVEAVADALATRRREGRQLPTLLYTVPNFQNPTGSTLAPCRRERLLELASEYDFVVLEDDPYGELRYDGDPVASLKALDDEGRVVRVGTFSKTIAPGVRTGWAIAHPEIADAIGGLNAGGTNTFTRGVVARYCESGLLEENVAALRTDYEERRDHMLRKLEEHAPAGTTWTEPDGGFFVWVELPGALDARELLSAAADEGVVYLPGRMFYPDAGGENCLRLSFSHVSMEEMTRGIEALGRTIREALDGS